MHNICIGTSFLQKWLLISKTGNNHSNDLAKDISRIWSTQKSGDQKEVTCREEDLKNLDKWTQMKLIISVQMVQKSVNLWKQMTFVYSSPSKTYL